MLKRFSCFAAFFFRTGSDVNRRPSLRTVLDFDFGVNLISDQEIFWMNSTIGSPESTSINTN